MANSLYQDQPLRYHTPQTQQKPDSPRRAADNYSREYESGEGWDSGLRYKTRSGIRVRSKIEKIIADFLFAEGIRFIYEPEVCLGRSHVRPDFYLPDYQVFYEHFGVNDPEYWRTAQTKISRYRQSGAPFIYTTIEDEPDIEDVIVDKLAEATLDR